MGNFGHVPVLLEEVIAALQPLPQALIVDATFGAGGYSRALLAHAATRVVGVDRDPAAVARGLALAAAEPRFTMLEGRFSELEALLATAGIGKVDGIVADLGLSSLQLDDPARGFSFQGDGPLDMRMGAAGPTAADLLRDLGEEDLRDLLRRHGDEPQAGRIAKTIVARRAAAPLTRTGELRALVARAKGGRQGAPRDPATQTFQALRIAVNDEVSELEGLVEAAVGRLRPGGRLAIVSFHSGEDRAVKQAVDGRLGRPLPRSRHLPPAPAAAAAVLAWAAREPIRPGTAEIAANPRARSAKLRVALRLPSADEAAGESADEPWRMAA